MNEFFSKLDSIIAASAVLQQLKNENVNDYPIFRD